MSLASHQLEAARRRHEAGDFAQAEALYHRLLATSPRDAEILHLLGALERQTGRAAAAIARLQQAINLRGDDATMHFNLAVAWEDAGQVAQAEATYREALRLAPGFVEAHLNLAALKRRLGRLDEAEQCYRAVLAERPDCVPAMVGIGIVWQKQGDNRRAADAYRQALDLEPANRQARFNLATVLHQLGDSAAAIEQYHLCLKSDSLDSRTHQNVAHVLAELGELYQAERHYRRAIELRPEDGPAHLYLAALYYRQRRYVEAAASCRQAIVLRPDWPAAHLQLGLAVSHTQGPEAGVRCLEYAARLEPHSLLRQVAALSAGQTVFRHDCEIDDYRARLAQRLDAIFHSPAKLRPADIPSSFCKPPFCLPYQGRDDRPLKEQFATIFARHIQPAEPAPGPRTGLPHVGLVVTAGHEGVFLRGMAGIIRRVEPNRLRLTVVCYASGRKRLQQALGNDRVEFLMLPGDFEQAVSHLREARLDVLHFWEIGTDSVNYFLPFFRCAPVQVTSWGWPTTSGMAAVDYFLSSELLESSVSDSHYSERLVRLTTLPTCYRRPRLATETSSRSELGLPERLPVYLCPQNLAKFHPGFDPLVGAILRADPRGIFVALESREGHVTVAVRQRMTHAMPDVATRIRFLPRVALERFPSLLQSADVLLDTPHYSGGANTTFDVLGQALPLVSLRGAYHRGRWAAACYARMQMPAGIIDSPQVYVATAVRLANDRATRSEWSRQIAASNRVLFDEELAVHETVEFWIQAAAEGRARWA